MEIGSNKKIYEHYDLLERIAKDAMENGRSERFIRTYLHQICEEESMVLDELHARCIEDHGDHLVDDPSMIGFCVRCGECIC